MTRLSLHRLALAAAALPFIASSACIIVPRRHHEVIVEPAGREVYVETEPGAVPAPLVETITVSPGPDHEWVHGHWAWRDGRYAWIGGHWERRPHAHARWVVAHWDRRGGRWYWIDGHWG
jgi:hypothetical protein